MRIVVLALALLGLALASSLPSGVSAAGATARVEPSVVAPGGHVLLILQVTSPDLLEATVTPRVDCTIRGPAAFLDSPCARDLGLAEVHVLASATREYVFPYDAPNLLGTFSVELEYHGLLTLLPQDYHATASFQVVSAATPPGTTSPTGPSSPPGPSGTAPSGTGPSGSTPPGGSTSSTGPPGSGPGPSTTGPGGATSPGGSGGTTRPQSGGGLGTPGGPGGLVGEGRPGPEPVGEPQGPGHLLEVGPPTLGQSAFRFHVANSLGIATLSVLLIARRMNFGA